MYEPLDQLNRVWYRQFVLIVLRLDDNLSVALLRALANFVGPKGDSRDVECVEYVGRHFDRRIEVNGERIVDWGRDYILDVYLFSSRIQYLNGYSSRLVVGPHDPKVEQIDRRVNSWRR